MHDVLEAVVSHGDTRVENGEALGSTLVEI